ncbi:MAG: Crp/Fnr family transcriptional regulator [Candidatus Bipolaricaulia bacterium]
MQLLRGGVSSEKTYPEGSVILKEGTMGDTIFLIGVGSVRVTTRKEDDSKTTLSIVKKGDFFGEMALFEQRPRAATVTANEDCTLLEVEGQEFLKLLHEHTNIAFEILLKLSERLRHTNEQVMGDKLKDIDEKLNLFTTKFDTELKVVDSSLREARTMFDHMKSRADDTIDSVERTRTWLTWIAGIIVFIITIGGGIGGSAVYWYAKGIKGLHDQAKEDAAALENWRKQSENLGHQVSVVFYEKLWERKPDDPIFTLRLLNEIELVLASQPEYSRVYTGRLQEISGKAVTFKEKIYAYYVLLASQILADQKEDFTKSLSAFGKYLKEHKDQKGDIDFSVLEALFAEENKEKRESFQGVKDLIAAR